MTREDKRRWTLLSYQGHNAAEGPVIADDERVEVMPVPPVEVTDEARELLAEVYRPEGVEIWLSGRNRSLGGERPIDLIERGEGARVLAHIRQISVERPAVGGDDRRDGDVTREEQIERVWQLLVEPRETDASLSLLATRIVDALAQPVEITDELAERVCRAFLGSDAISLLKCFDAHGALVKYIYVADGDGLRGMRDALRTALEAGP